MRSWIARIPSGHGVALYVELDEERMVAIRDDGTWRFTDPGFKGAIQRALTQLEDEWELL